MQRSGTPVAGGDGPTLPHPSAEGQYWAVIMSGERHLPRAERLEALDAFRGLTIAGMLLVNNPGTWSAVYPPLRHAAWHGWTPTDLIFPFFLFIVGITTHLSLSSRERRGDAPGAITRQILRRGALIILFGLALAAFPYVPLDHITGVRIPGVLQRIGICYIAAAFLARGRSTSGVAGLAAALLVGYWLLLALVPNPETGVATWDVPDATLAAWVDRALLDGHLWSETGTWDPEGILSTIPAVGTCLLGLLAGRLLGRSIPLAERLNGLFAMGALGTALGGVWGWVFPINKNLWTSSYVVFTAGLACLTLAVCLWAIDVRGRRGWARPFVSYGLNPMLAYIGSGFMARLLGMIRVPATDGSLSLQQAVYEGAFASWLPPLNASLGYAVAFVAVWYGILVVLERRGVVFRI
jgi:predicted acyltransferase